MNTENKTSKIHPLMAAAAIAIILACLTGIAAMTGLLPNFNKNTPPVATTAITINEPATASAPAVTTPVPPAPAAAPAAPVIAAAPPEPAPAPKVVHKKPVKKPVKKAAPEPDYQEQYSQAPPYCPNCGVVESVRAIAQEGPSSGIGAGVGAVLGGLLGNQIGGGTGQTVATIAGAVGGGYAGNVIEKRRSATTAFEVIVRMDNGGRQRFILHEPRWRSGDSVRVEDGHLYAR